MLTAISPSLVPENGHSLSPHGHPTGGVRPRPRGLKAAFQSPTHGNVISYGASVLNAIAAPERKVLNSGRWTNSPSAPRSARYGLWRLAARRAGGQEHCRRAYRGQRIRPSSRRAMQRLRRARPASVVRVRTWPDRPAARGLRRALGAGASSIAARSLDGPARLGPARPRPVQAFGIDTLH